MTTRVLSCQPDAPDGRPWLVLVEADVGALPGCGPVLVTESSHEREADARRALEAAATRDAREAHDARDARGAHDA